MIRGQLNRSERRLITDQALRSSSEIDRTVAHAALDLDDALKVALEKVGAAEKRAAGLLDRLAFVDRKLLKIDCECAGEGVETCYRCEALAKVRPVTQKPTEVE